MKPVGAIQCKAGAFSGTHPVRARGMTIIELTVVLIVVGVLATLVVAPTVGGMVARHRVQGVHSELLGDLRLARSEQAQRNGTSTPVSIAFSGNADLTCYTIHTGSASCDCTRAPHQACAAVPDAEEIKTMQFERAVGVSVAASSPVGARITFDPPQGLATPDNLVIDVQSTTRGQLRTSISGLGVPTVCSPDGSIPGVRTC
jgi:prepilin-type N-terminal cleavage/methylation domain-containing protein